MTMTIEQAIRHIDESIANGAMCEECCKEHLQLKQWLLENIELKKENTELKKQVIMFQKKEKEKEQAAKVLMDEYRR